MDSYIFLVMTQLVVSHVGGLILSVGVMWQRELSFREVVALQVA